MVISNCVINLSDDKAATLAEAFRVLRPGGRFGVSDVVTEDAIPDQDLRRRTETRIGCTAGSLTVGEYRTLLLDAGFTGIAITPTADHGDGVHSAIVKAAKPPVAPGFEIRPMRAARGRWRLDHPIRRVPREHGQPGPAPGGRLPRPRHPRTHRPPSRRLARRPHD
ncbi:hypothetical protein SAMN05421833_11871 [Microbispora rosea]|uniref:Methyltransferase domain-containing protein n=1 Tax=Microbispora rosea TaxID=58117 RepID=A0A1N7EJQ9_9ACTN|nr:hypothetical protein Mro03_51690 [Microbispora rosea subsp. rosea]SIR88333.1 hypothetical protein SAMN05421833_11871 [Microbispora rosea]